MQPSGRRRHRALLAREHGLIVDAVLVVRRRAARRCKAAAAWRRARAMASSSARLAEVEGQGHLALLAALFHRRGESAEQADTARPRRRRCGRLLSAAWQAAPAPASFWHRACWSASPRSVRAFRRARACPLSSAGMTLVSLNTSASPGERSSAGRRSFDRRKTDRRRARPRAAAPRRAGSPA